MILSTFIGMLTVSQLAAASSSVLMPTKRQSSLASASFYYTSDARVNGCCPMLFTKCAGADGEEGAGKVTIDIAAKRTEGTSLSANLTHPSGYPGGFNQDLKCDASGRLCWMVTRYDDAYTGSLCVHLDGDYNCADYAVDVTGANDCDDNYVTLNQIMG
ncbi:hypothetical protein B0H11DRAFT_1955227 [Mycena galericulata]|nr:hypothetical protein B0H11DRAFT_1955227 [Mycena galericulata]